MFIKVTYILIITVIQCQTLNLNHILLTKNLVGAKRGSAPGPNGMRMEHLKPLLDDSQHLDCFLSVCTQYARAAMPESIAAALNMCHLTALRKGTMQLSDAHGPSNRVRGLAVGDTIRRLVAKTLAQQFQPEFESQTSPHQFGISKGGVEAAVHLMQAIADSNPNHTGRTSTRRRHRYRPRRGRK